MNILLNQVQKFLEFPEGSCWTCNEKGKTTMWCLGKVLILLYFWRECEHDLKCLNAVGSDLVRSKQNNGGQRTGQEYMNSTMCGWLTSQALVWRVRTWHIDRGRIICIWNFLFFILPSLCFCFSHRKSHVDWLGLALMLEWKKRFRFQESREDFLILCFHFFCF